MDPSAPRRWRATWAAVLVVAAVIVPALWLAVARLSAPADGTGTFPSAPPWTGDGVVLSAAHGEAGAAEPEPLRTGDRIVAVDGVALAAWAERPRPVRAGERLTYTVVRDGRRFDVTVTLGAYPVVAVTLAHLAVIPLLVVQFLVSAFVLLRRSDDRTARAMFTMVALVPLGMTAYPYSTQIADLVSGRLWPLLLGDAANAVLWGAVLHFGLLFPQPRRLLARHPRLAAVAAYGLPFLLYAGYLAVTLPRAGSALERYGRLATISVPAANVVPILAGVLVVTGYFATRDPVVRSAVRWVLATFAFAAILYLGLGQLAERVRGAPLVPWDWQALFFLPFPVAVGAAVLRRRMFDIELILRRSLVYGVLTASLVLVYLGSVALLGRAFDSPFSLAPLLAGAVVAILFQPLRGRLQRTVSRLVFGDRDDPYEVLRRLGQRLEATASAESALAGVAETLAQTLRLSYVAVELTGLEPQTASHGRPTGHALTLPLTHRDEEVGRLVLDTGPVREPFGPDDRALLEGLARQVAMTAHNVLLTARLQRSLERTVTAREEERRRLRRDIHDGLGPTLASGGMRLELARSLLHRDPDAAAELLDGLAETQRQAIADIRRLVDGLRPPVLDQLGLVSAIRERADRFAGSVAIAVDAADDLGPLTAAVEVAAYHIVAEALTNVVRHAGAAACTVRLWREAAGALVVEVSDDGTGLPDVYRAGVGLTAMRERAAELGGECTAGRGPAGGTTIVARLPLLASA